MVRSAVRTLLALALLGFAAAPAFATSIAHVEFLRGKTVYGAQTLTSSGASVSASGAPDFGSGTTPGVARIVTTQGAVIVVVGTGAQVATQTNGVWLAAGQGPIDFPVMQGDIVAVIEASDQPAAGGGGGGGGAVTNAGTFAVQNTAATPAGTNLIGKVGIDQTTPGTTNAIALSTLGSTTIAAGNGVTGAGSPRVTIASDNTPFSVNVGTVTTLPALPANQSTNEAQVNGVAPLMGNGVTGTGSQRVTIASDNTAFSVNSTLQTAADTTMVGGANIKEINAVAPLMGNGVTGTGSLRVTLASDTSSNTNPLLFNQSQVNGVAMLAGNGVTGTGSQRVTIASDNTAFAVNATLQTGAAIVGKVGIDQTTDITTNGVEIAPTAAAAAGITPVVSTVIESGHILKGSGGNLYSVTATVNNNANGQIMVFNSATVPADGAVTPIECVNVNAGGTVSINPGQNGPPEAFSTGISVAFSSAGSCVSKTASANAFFNGKVK